MTLSVRRVVLPMVVVLLVQLVLLVVLSRVLPLMLLALMSLVLPLVLCPQRGPFPRHGCWW